MDHFSRHTQPITLYSGSVNLPYDFRITKESAAGENDGFLRYDETITSYSYTITHHDTGTDLTSEISNTDDIDDTQSTYYTIKIGFDYPTTALYGRYDIEFLLNISTDAGSGVRPCNYYKLNVLES